MDSYIIWIVRGLNGPNKHTEVKLLRNKLNVGIIGMVETKIKVVRLERVTQNMFPG